ncbi:MAG: hypothetical protein VX727_09690 [Planctomycetota bacterium]|nr:hypothetical protein [Planctomycetota bacterium]
MRTTSLLFLALLLLLPGAPQAMGDGGVVRASGGEGPWTITLVSSPTPFRAGPIDLSILLQRPESDEAVLDADVNLMLRPLDGQSTTMLVEATREQATNKLLYAALLDLPAGGRWQVDVSVQLGDDTGRLSATLIAGEAVPAAWNFWGWLAIPAIVILLYACNQWLVRTRRRGATSRKTPLP